MKVTLPWMPKELSPNARVHWAVKSRAAKSYKEACYWLCRQSGLTSVPWDGEIHLWLDFYPPTKRRRDDDNIEGHFKYGRDGIAQALGIDDGRFRAHKRVMDEIGGMVKVELTREPSRPCDSSGSKSAPAGGKQA